MTIETALAEIAQLRHHLEGANQIIADLHADLAQSRQQIEREKNRANSVLAAQGLLPQDVPKGDANGNRKTPWATYQELRASNPFAAAEYYDSHADEIIKSRNKS